MAVFKLADPGKNVYDENYIAEKIQYILQPQKILSNYWGGFFFLKSSVENVIKQFYIVRNIYHRKDYIPLRHYIISFDGLWEYEITPFQAKCIAHWICLEFANCMHQVIYAVHEDTSNLHIHILLNTVNIANGSLFDNNIPAFYGIRDTVDYVLKNYLLWLGEKPLKLFS